MEAKLPHIPGYIAISEIPATVVDLSDKEDVIWKMTALLELVSYYVDNKDGTWPLHDLETTIKSGISCLLNEYIIHLGEISNRLGYGELKQKLIKPDKA